MAEKLYSVKINNSGRYILHCDDCWYETTEAELRIFDRKRAEEIRDQLKNHYVYSVTISDGTETLAEECPMKSTAVKVPDGVTCVSDGSWGGGLEW